MGLYLCVFDGDVEVDGVEVGSYEDFGTLRDLVTRELENGVAGSVFPTFISHHDSDGEWNPEECAVLVRELTQIATALKAMPPLPLGEWQRGVAKEIGFTPKNAFESFIDVDGELLLDRLRALAETSQRRGLPILFQ